MRAGEEHAAEEALRGVVPPSREEPGCVAIDAFRALNDGRLFFIHSRWRDEAAFDEHAGLAHTVHFLARMTALSDEPPDLVRVRPVTP